MKARLTLLVIAFASLGPLRAQVPSALPAGAAVKIAQSTTARDEAATLFKVGDVQGGLAKLVAAVKTGARSPAAEIQIVSHLCSIARDLSANQNPAGRDTALLAASESAKAKTRLTRGEAAALDAQVGSVYEMILGDRANARLSYQSALAFDATRKDAQAGLDRLAQLEALIRAKDEENAVVRSRGK